MNDFIETLYDVMFQPRAAMRAIAADRRIGQALAVFLLASVLPLLPACFSLRSAGMGAIVNLIIVAQVFGGLVKWVAAAAVWQLISELFGGRGTAVGLLASLGFAHLPLIFITPFLVLSAYVPSIATPVMLIVGLVVFLWVVTLDVIAIQEVEGLSGAQAFLVLIIPPVLILLVVLAVLAAGIGTIMSHIPHF